VFDNMIRMQGSPVEAVGYIIRWISGYPRKEKKRTEEASGDSK